MDSFMLEPDRVTRIFDEPESELEPEPEPQLEPEPEPEPESKPQLDAGPKLQPKHKIFLSHSGAQKDFVEQLCVDLESFHHFPFFDKRPDSLPKGERFPHLIFEAARQCRVAVVVLSEEFFTRTKWPMLELDAFVKAQKLRDGHPRILPLFFQLTRAQCHERARRERWLEVWRGWARDDSRILIEDWVAALNVFGPINGIEYKSEGEVSYRKAARAAIVRLVPPDLQFDTSFLEGSERFCKVILDKFHEIEASIRYGVRVVGVYGVGGLGKTSVCKALCNTQFAEYDGNVCLAELGSLSPEKLQKQVSRELIHVNPEHLEVVLGDQGVRLLKDRMHRQKVFLAIDNVWDYADSLEEAKTFLEAGFHCESMVLVTARTIDILSCLNIDRRHCIEMPELNKEEAMNLFLHHAIPHLRELESAQRAVVEQCVQRCWFGKGGVGVPTTFHYLPLAIKVLGSQLGSSSDDPLDWRERLSNLNLNPSQDRVHPIFSILRTGYDSLSEDQKLLFMDVALFCPRPLSYNWSVMGDRVSSDNVFYWLSLLHTKSVDFIKHNLQILKRRSILEDFGDGFTRITLHDLYYEFAVFESQAMDFIKRRWLFADYASRLRITSEVFPLMADVPEGLQQNPGLSCWPALRRIAICNSQLPSLGRFGLQYCSNIDLLKLVNCDHLEKVDLDGLGCLKFLEVSGCSKLKASSSGIECLRELVWLRWSGSFPEPCFADFFYVKSLRVLELSGQMGRGGSLSNLSSLEDCVHMVDFTLVDHPELLAFPDLSRMEVLRKVRFSVCRKARGLRGLSSKMTQLQELLLDYCDGIVELPGVEDLVNLKKFELHYCGVMGPFPNLKELTCLDTLSCVEFDFRKPAGISGLIYQEELPCNKSDDLMELPDLSPVRTLKVLRLPECNMENLHGFKISHLTGLQVLDCDNSKELIEVPDLRSLSQIQVICFCGCSKLTSVLEANIGLLTTLQSLNLSYTSISTLPDLSSLKDLRACYFSHTPVTALPVGFARLATIPELEMEHCMLLRIPLLDLLAECILEAQQLAAMKALHSIYDNDVGCINEVHPSSAPTFIRLLECLDCSGNQSSLRIVAARLLLVMSFQFGSTANRGFNTSVLEVLGQVDGGVEKIIRVFCEHKDVDDLFYVIAGFFFMGHCCPALRASETLHQMRRNVIKLFSLYDSFPLFTKEYMSLPYVLGIIAVDPVVASAFGDEVVLDYLERFKLRCVNHNFRDLNPPGWMSIPRYPEDNPALTGDQLKQLFLVRIDALLGNVRLAFESHGRCSKIGDDGC